MDHEKQLLTASEWSVMECLWESAPCSAMQLVAFMKSTIGWAKSTTLTTLSRMQAKGLVLCRTQGKAKQYLPNVAREDAAQSETRSFLGRVYSGSVGMMMQAMVDSNELTEREIDELYAILKQAGGKTHG